MIEEQKGIREQCLCAGTATTRGIATVMKRHHVVVRKKAMQLEGHGFGIPGIPAKA
jgi:hypothetical protein